MHDMCQWLNTKSDLRPKQAWVCNCSKELFFTHIFSVPTTCFRQRSRTRPHHVRTHQNPTQRVSNSYSKGIPESPKVSPVSQEHYSSWDLNASKTWTGATLWLHPFPQPPPWRRPPNQHSHIPAPECAGLQHHSCLCRQRTSPSNLPSYPCCWDTLDVWDVPRANHMDELGVWHSYGFWHKRISEYIRFKKMTRTLWLGLPLKTSCKGGHWTPLTNGVKELQMRQPCFLYLLQNLYWRTGALC